MLLDFTVSNFRSFRSPQTLSMIPEKGGNDENLARIGEDWQVLRSGIIYGANASGKSNLMLAMRALRELILKSARNEPDMGLHQYQPFAFGETTEEQPVLFEINFLLEGVRYHYRVQFMEFEVVEEVLNYYPKGRTTRLYSRKKQEFAFGESLKGAKQTIEKLTASNQLYLSNAAINNMDVAVDIYRYFSKKFMTIPLLNVWTDDAYLDVLIKNILESREGDPFLNNLKSLLCSLDTGMTDFLVKEDPVFELDKIFVEHGVFDENGNKIGHKYQPFDEESTGTQKLFVVGGLILRALMNGQVIIIDEFERSLHPYISTFILRLFNQSKTNHQNAQLIVATHDTNLLSQENRLQRDQIFLVEKDQTGSSELFSIADMEGIRKDIPFEKWYLSGRFGGIPHLEILNFELNFEYEEEVR